MIFPGPHGRRSGCDLSKSRIRVEPQVAAREEWCFHAQFLSAMKNWAGFHRLWLCKQTCDLSEWRSCRRQPWVFPIEHVPKACQRWAKHVQNMDRNVGTRWHWSFLVLHSTSFLGSIWVNNLIQDLWLLVISPPVLCDRKLEAGQLGAWSFSKQGAAVTLGSCHWGSIQHPKACFGANSTSNIIISIFETWRAKASHFFWASAWK